MDRDDSSPFHFLDSSGYPARVAPILGDGEYSSIGLVSEGRATSHGTPILDQDEVARSNHAKSGRGDPKDLGYILSGLHAQQLGDINAPKSIISKRANSTVMGIGVIAGGVLVALLAVLLLGILPCYLKRRRARREKTIIVGTENGTTTQMRQETYNNETPLPKPLSVVKEESIRSILSLSLASSETAVHTVEAEERRSPPPITRPLGTANLPSSPLPSLRRPGDRTEETIVIAPPQRVLVRPDSADRGRDRVRVEDTASVAPMRSRSVRFAERNSRQMPLPAQSRLSNPWGSGGAPPPPLPGSSFERVQLFRLPESAPPERPPRRARSLKAAGLPRSPRDLPVSVRAETRSPSIPDSTSEYSRSGDARHQSRAV